MADTTISGLDSGIPNKNSAIIPYSDGSTTYKTSPSGIVAASPGSTLQVVQYTFGVQSTSTSSNYTDSNIIGTITPISTSSKIRIDISTQLAVRNTSGGVSTSNYGFYNLVRNNTELLTWGAVQQVSWVMGNCQYIDSTPIISIAPITYKVQHKIGGGAGTVYTGWGTFNTPTLSIMVLTEIAG